MDKYGLNKDKRVNLPFFNLFLFSEKCKIMQIISYIWQFFTKNFGLKFALKIKYKNQVARKNMYK